MPSPSTSVSIASDCVTAHVGGAGAHVAPVIFRQGDVSASPYSLAPWRPGEFPGLPPLLDELGGDFLCLPFGEEEGWSPHGEVASAEWTLQEHGAGHVTLACAPQDVGGHVTKAVSVRDGEPALYQEFRIRDVTGELPYGTHPIIDVSRMPTGGARVSTSAFMHGQVFPGAFSSPDRGEVQRLEPGAVFVDLAHVPMSDGGTMDISRYPTPSGHEDLVMLVNDPAAGPLGWSAVSCSDFLWIALKDVRQFPSTVLWLSNGGRTAPPWDGRHVGRIGVEEVCAYFSLGPTASRDNPLRARGIATTASFDVTRETVLRTVHVAVVPPPGFGRVASLETPDAGHIVAVDDDGTSVLVPVQWTWVLGDQAP